MTFPSLPCHWNVCHDPIFPIVKFVWTELNCCSSKSFWKSYFCQLYVDGLIFALVLHLENSGQFFQLCTLVQPSMLCSSASSFLAIFLIIEAYAFQVLFHSCNLTRKSFGIWVSHRIILWLLSTSEMSFSLHHCYLGTLLLGICAVKGLRWTHKASVLILGFLSACWMFFNWSLTFISIIQTPIDADLVTI